MGRAQARAMMGAPKCCSHTSRGVCVPGEIDSVFLLCFGGDFFRCSINQKLPKVTCIKIADNVLELLLGSAPTLLDLRPFVASQVHIDFTLAAK